MGMKIDKRTLSKKKFSFVLSYQNQKGQVAIFVALIFQVIFIFFALLINVGLLVHHKINLQHSTDLAAYYGAMKQAEGMNAIAHVNFQIKQSWKLLTWRYRVLGTFGFIKDAGGLSQDYPFEYTGVPAPLFTYNGSQGVSTINANGTANMKCTNDPTMRLPDGTYLGIQDIPFFCVGHDGFSNWPQGESNCQLQCSTFVQPRVITQIPAPTNSNTPFGGNVAGAIIAAVAQVNANLSDKCMILGPTGAIYLSRFMMGYINEVTPRLRTIEMLAKDLSLDAKEMVDIEGKKIFSGSETTFKNNLTGANFAGLSAASFQAYNGLSDQKCKFNDGLSGNQEFLKKIEFDFLNYFIHNCTPSPGTSGAYKPESVYSATSASGLGPAFDTMPQNIKDIMTSVLNNGQKHTIGYEKNPHCVEYYAVKAFSEPNIPFLPLAKIRLQATAVAKPFGGSIGPWFGREWPFGSKNSQYTPNQPSSQTDETLPNRKFQPGLGNPAVESVYSQPNFAQYVGDKLGLRDLDYLAAYHSMLQIRDIKNYGSKTYAGNKNISGKMGNNPSTPPFVRKWPGIDDWKGIDNASIDFKTYDTMASADADSGVRAIEITAIAPNQFDIAHYSIDSDFYNNYYKKLYKGFDNIASAVGGAGSNFDKDKLRADLGSVGMLPNNPDPDVTAPLISDRTFSVKDQILLKNVVLDTVPSQGVGPYRPSITYAKILNSLVNVQSSLLTGWTFASYSDYSMFPNAPVNTVNQTMSFGQCANAWNNTSQALNSDQDPNNFSTPMNLDSKLPPVPGNCVTGGRTGYSVKIISPSLLLPGAATQIENTIDPAFFSF